MKTTTEILDLEHTIAASLFDAATYPWEVLGKISDYILSLGETFP